MTIVNVENIAYSPASPIVIAIPSGANRFVIWAWGYSSGDMHTAVNLGNIPMTNYGNAAVAGETFAQIWGAWIPNDVAAGNATVVGNVGGGGATRWNASTFTGVSIDPVVDFVSLSLPNNVDPHTNSITINAVNGGWVVDMIGRTTTSSLQIGSGQTNMDGGFAPTRSGYSYRTPPITQGSVTMGWTISGDRHSAHCAVSLRPAKPNNSIIII